MNALKHSDPHGLTATDWDMVIGLLPSPARESFATARAARKELCERLLGALAQGEGGLTTWDPDWSAWIKNEFFQMEDLGRRVELAAAHALIRRLGAVEYARMIAGRAG